MGHAHDNEDNHPLLHSDDLPTLLPQGFLLCYKLPYLALFLGDAPSIVGFDGAARLLGVI